MLPAVDCTSATSEHSADLRIVITQVKTQKQNLPPLFRQAEQSDCQRFIFHNHLFSSNNKYSRHLLNDKVFICAERLKVYFFEILKRYFVLLLSLYFAIRVESNMVKHRFAKACARYVHGVVPYPSIQSSPFFSAGGIDSKRPHGFIPYGR